MPTVTPEIAAEFPFVVIMIVFIAAAATGGFAFVKWLLAWQEKQAEIWRNFLSEQDVKRDAQNIKRDTILERLANAFDAMQERYGKLEAKVDTHHALVEQMAGKKKGMT